MRTTGQERSPKAFLPVYKARTNELYTFRQCTYIAYVFIYYNQTKYFFMETINTFKQIFV